MLPSSIYFEDSSTAVLVAEPESETIARGVRGDQLLSPTPIDCDESSTTIRIDAAFTDGILPLLRFAGEDSDDSRLLTRLLCKVSATGSAALSAIIAAYQRDSADRAGLAKLLEEIPRAKESLGAAETRAFLRYFLFSADPALRLGATYGYLLNGEREAAKDLRAAMGAEKSSIVRRQLEKAVRLLGV